ncbi:CZB domain-containing protein [Lentilitoribacter sp. EG35]|uniref:CZB domain-containing protein n=1 Tax=Lentilitoribacter sp. EG35 TaxID=3234192 RepID=UPI00345F19C5
MSNNTIRENIQKAIGAHGAWKMKLRTAITHGSSEITPDKVRCDDQCEFGKWLYSPSIDPQTRNGKPYQVVRRLHAEFHVCAADVLEHAVNQRAQQAGELIEGEFADRSKILTKALTKWKGELTG